MSPAGACRRFAGLFSTTVVIALAATSATAAAETLCFGPAGSAVTSARANGTCSNPTATPKTLVEQSQVAELEGEVADLERNVSALEKTVKELQIKLSPVIYDATGENGLPTLRIVGNLQIVNGTGTTDGHVNGLGNLFIGYNEHYGSDEQTGSHNLIIGTHHTFTSAGGLLAGSSNSIYGPWSSVTGGANNIATGANSSVSGGLVNMASGDQSSVSGGAGNTASGNNSSVSGGKVNTASEMWSSVSGGSDNMASGDHASVSGGQGNTAYGGWSSILGGDGITLSASHGTSP